MAATTTQKSVSKSPSKKVRGVPVCPHSNKSYTDINHSERGNRNFVCGDCGTRFPLSAVDAKKDIIIVPKHQVPAALHALRKDLERKEKVSRNH